MDKFSQEDVKKVLTENKIPKSIEPESIKKMLDEKAKGNNERADSDLISGAVKPKKDRRRIIKRTAYIGTAAAVLAGVIGFSVYQKNIQNNSAINDVILSGEIDGVRYAKSYRDIYDELGIGKTIISDENTDDFAYSDGAAEIGEEGNIDIPTPNENADIGGVQENDADYATGFTTAETQHVSSASEKKDYSEALDQENGVKEADIVKTDGNMIYIAMPYENNGVRAVKADNGKLSDVSAFAEDTGSVLDLYIYNDRIIVISSKQKEDDHSSNTLVTVYSKDKLEKIGSYEQSGFFTDVRLKENGMMYIVSDDMDICIFDEHIEAEQYNSYIPSYCADDKTELVDHSDIILNTIEQDDFPEYVNVSVLDMNSDTPCQPTDMRSIAGSIDNIYCSYDALYLTCGYDQTQITKLVFSGKNIIPSAGTTIKGSVLDQFSMSEYNGCFRVAATFETIDLMGVYTGSTNNILYVLDEKLDTIGSVTNFGRGEMIKSVNFQGDTAYVVTFEQTDPLFSIDLTDPKAPVIKDALKVTGYSSYMQKWDNGRLLGFGEAADDEGNILGVKMSMFDNSDQNALKELDKTEWLSEWEAIDMDADGYSYSEKGVDYEAPNDRKAYLIYPEKNIIGVPIYAYRYDENYKLKKEYDFFSFENGKFKKLGSIVSDTDIDHYSDNTRCVVIGDHAYAVFGGEIIAADINNGFTVTANEVFELNPPEDIILYD